MDIEELTGRELFVDLRNILCSAAGISGGLSIIDTSLGPMFRVIHLANLLLFS